jgi:ribosomal protein S18 acetylase RimI-like enzyme
MIELRASRPEEVPQLQALFQLCFGDGPELSGLYFAHFYRPEEYLVLREDDQLRAMAGVLSLALTEPDGRQVKAAYLYGVGTHPDHRGKGYAGQLLHYADFYLRGKRDCLLTVPADDPLHGFYQRFGFSEAFPLLEGEVLPRAPVDGETSRPLSAAAYDALRERLLTGRGHVSYGALTGLQERLCAFSDGALLALDVNGVPGCAVVERWGDTALCKELLIPPAGLEGAVALAAQAVFAPRFRLRLPAWDNGADKKDRPHCPCPLTARPFGMIKWYDPIARRRWGNIQAPYLGLAFD